MNKAVLNVNKLILMMILMVCFLAVPVFSAESPVPFSVSGEVTIINNTVGKLPLKDFSMIFVLQRDGVWIADIGQITFDKNGNYIGSKKIDRADNAVETYQEGDRIVAFTTVNVKPFPMDYYISYDLLYRREVPLNSLINIKQVDLGKLTKIYSWNDSGVRREQTFERYEQPFIDAAFNSTLIPMVELEYGPELLKDSFFYKQDNIIYVDLLISLRNNYDKKVYETTMPDQSKLYIPMQRATYAQKGNQRIIFSTPGFNAPNRRQYITMEDFNKLGLPITFTMKNDIMYVTRGVASNVGNLIQDEPIGIQIKGNRISSDVPPTVVDGRTLAPARAVLESLGWTMEWVAETRTVKASNAGKTIELTIDSKTAKVDGKAVTLDVPAQVINGRTLVPLRFIGESTGAAVKWDGESRTVTIE